MSTLKLLHISDTHFLKEYNGSIERWGVDYDPGEMLKSFLSSYDFEGIDAVVHTGDLIHDGEEEDYIALKKLIEQHVPERIPVYYCLGNHDKKREFHRGFFSNEKDGIYLHEEDLKGYRLIFLDTASEEIHDGVIDDKQADWLFNRLDNHSENGTLIFQHHPLEISWIHNLEQTKIPSNYVERLNKTDVLGIFTGHLHQNRHVMIGNIPQHTAGAFIFGMNRIAGEIWNTNRLGYSEIEVRDGMVDVYTEIFNPKVERFNTEIL